MSDVSRAPTVICQRCLHSPWLSPIPLLFLPFIFLPATYYLQISLLLISFYSISACDNFSYSLFSSCVCVSFVILLPLISTQLQFHSLSQRTPISMSNLFLRHYQSLPPPPTHFFLNGSYCFSSKLIQRQGQVLVYCNKCFVMLCSLKAYTLRIGNNCSYFTNILAPRASRHAPFTLCSLHCNTPEVFSPPDAFITRPTTLNSPGACAFNFPTPSSPPTIHSDNPACTVEKQTFFSSTCSPSN